MGRAVMTQLFGYIILGKGVVGWICLLAPGTSTDVLIWDREGPQWAKGPFKDHEVGANCSLLLTVLCLWEGGGVDASLVAKAFALLRGHWGGDTNQTFWAHSLQKWCTVRGWCKYSPPLLI